MGFLAALCGERHASEDACAFSVFYYRCPYQVKLLLTQMGSVLVPASAKCQVVRALEDGGFAFQKRSHSYINPSTHHRHLSSSPEPGSPTSPSPLTASDLQAQTFSLLERHGIFPHADRDMYVVLIICLSCILSPNFRKSLFHPKIFC